MRQLGLCEGPGEVRDLPRLQPEVAAGEGEAGGWGLGLARAGLAKAPQCWRSRVWVLAMYCMSSWMCTVVLHLDTGSSKREGHEVVPKVPGMKSRQILQGQINSSHVREARGEGRRPVGVAFLSSVKRPAHSRCRPEILCVGFSRCDQ